NRDRSIPLAPEQAQILQRQFDQGATVHAIHGKTPLRFELVTHNERGQMEVTVVDIATFEAYVGHVERNVVRATEALKKRGEWPRVELPSQEPIDVTEHAQLIEEPIDVTEHAQLVEEPIDVTEHATLIEEPVDVTEHAQLIEEAPIPIQVETPLPRFAQEGE